MMVEPIYRQLGWHTVGLDEMLEGQPLQIAQQYKTSRLSLFTIIVAKNAKVAPAIAVGG
jgi:hypothetical protein